MKADLTRITYRPGKNFSRVLMQQGRAQLDSDWNEQGALGLGTTRQLAADLIGPHGGPVTGYGPGVNGTVTVLPAFAVLSFGATGPKLDAADFLLLPGHYYVDGILCSNTTTPVIITGYPNAKGGTTNSISVFGWTTDGIAFQKNQYLWLYNSDPTKVAAPTSLVPQLLQISAVDYGNRTLTVTGNLQAYFNDASHNGTGTHFLRRAPSYMTQIDYAPPSLSDGEYQVYLDVWERAVTCAEDDSIREVALGGPDTTARAKTIAQVKVMPILATQRDDACPTPYELKAALEPVNRGVMAARAKPGQGSADPCTIAPDAMYRGPENQLYRVEIHTGSDVDGDSSLATFKWSRENGAVVFPIAGGGGSSFTLETLGRDDRFGLIEGDWVEVVDDSTVLANSTAPLRQVQSIDRTRMVVTLGGSAGTATVDTTKHPLLRRWDQKAGDPAQGGLTLGADNAALIFPPVKTSVALKKALPPMDANAVDIVIRKAALQASTSPWFELEDGVQVQFTLPPQYATEVQFRSGDYWLIPARVATGSVEWPTETIATGSAPATPTPIPLPPEGVVHHYAPIARINVSGTNVTVEDDCTVVFGPGNGVEGFLQGGQPYTNNIYELVFDTPQQPEQPEALVRKAPAKKAAEPKAAAAPASKK